MVLFNVGISHYVVLVLNCP